MKVSVSKKLLDAFHKRALKVAPREYGELLYGSCVDGKIRIAEFVCPPHLAGKTHFWYDHTKVEDERPAGVFLGTIHSHADNDEFLTLPLPSVEDWETVFEREETIHGICHIKMPNEKPRVASYFFLGAPAVLDVRLT